MQAFIFSLWIRASLKAGNIPRKVQKRIISGRKKFHEKVSALNITIPSLERRPSRWTLRVRTRRSIHDALCAETPWLAIKKIRDGSSFRLFSRNVPFPLSPPRTSFSKKYRFWHRPAAVPSPLAYWTYVRHPLPHSGTRDTPFDRFVFAT